MTDSQNGVVIENELVSEVYDDALHPFMNETGKTLALIPRVVNAALVPLREWISVREYRLAETEKLLSKKLENVAEEKIVTPDPFVAVPAIQAISYSMDSEELRNLYANLLANAMNVDKKNRVHPSFVEIIKQMSPIDATIFKLIFEKELRPLLRLDVVSGLERGYSVSVSGISWIRDYSFDSIAVSIDNLQRLGLVRETYLENYVNDDVYRIVRDNPEYLQIKNSLESAGEGVVEEKKGICHLTVLADAFYELCVKD